MEEKLLEQFPFLGHHQRWSGAVEVAERTTKDGRCYIILRLRIGSRSVLLPRRGLPDVILALNQALESANARYKGIIAKMNRRQ